MKSFTKSTAILTITLLITLNVSASNTFDEEAYINDIPFDTEAIYNHVLIERNILDITFEEEAYIDDIPFAVEEVAEKKLYELALNQKFSFEEEAYIDDIPFDTEQICQNLYQQSVTETITCDSEENLNASTRKEEIALKYVDQLSHIRMSY